MPPMVLGSTTGYVAGIKIRAPDGGGWIVD